MIAVGANVVWQTKGNLSNGVVRDFYQFKSKKWADKYSRALLIEKENRKFVLKLESEITIMS